ncbi:hypothetical protein HYT55_02620 [Candidatus Woesearchaeota archaeon]|nr:hypothetical protein [Candidatus Woesearchaeota archaeon]
MDLELLTFAETFYVSKGYKKIEVPWTVDQDVLDITLPLGRIGADLFGKLLVGSAEQSFLQLIKEKKLSPGKYVATTPCFRDDPVDDLHQKYFMKTELIDFSVEEREVAERLEQVMRDALEFFNFFLPIRKKQTDMGYDIVDDKREIELGSYGVRSHAFSEGHRVTWIYGTGIALPRLTDVTESVKKKGYHEMIIPKAPAGSFLKIAEEFREARDAYMNHNPIMLLVELADIYGAMELFLEKHSPEISMEDVRRLQEVTRRAFQNGRR